jgi:hypothetical protein
MAGRIEKCAMTPGFPTLICFSGSIAFFVASIRLRGFRMQENPPTSRTGLSLEERQKKIRIAGWLCFSLGLVMLASAILFEILGLRA